MTTTASIDERIRAAARAEWKRKVEAAFTVLVKEIGGIDGYKILRVGKEINSNGSLGIRMTPTLGADALMTIRPINALWDIREIIVELGAPNAEQKAIDRFLSRLDTLSDEIAEVRNLTGV